MLKTILAVLLINLIFFNASALASTGELPKEKYLEKDFKEETYRGKVLGVEEKVPTQTKDAMVEKRQIVQVEITKGPHQGEVFQIENDLLGDNFYDIKVDTGDHLKLRAEYSGEELENLYIQDFVRDTYIYYALFALAIALLAIGGFKGLKTIFTLFFALIAIFKIMLPLIAEGYNPLWLSVLLTSVVALISLCIIGGLNKKTLIAIIGTMGGVIIAGVMALIAGEAASLTGFSSEEAQMLRFTDIGEIDVQGLLFAGIIIGALGAVMDIGMSIASACSEMKEINPRVEKDALFKAGMNVGRDIMGTMSNTLVLAYTGSAMPLLLLFLAQDMTVTEMINLDIISTEIIRAVAGSMGLLVAIPITALTSSLFYGHEKRHKPSANSRK